MFQLVHTFELITGPLGRMYRPRAYGQPQANGLWDGWLVFFPTNAGSVVATERATTQDSIEALIDWAAALSLDYLQLGLERALELQPDAPVAAELLRLQRLETQASRSSRYARAGGGGSSQSRRSRGRAESARSCRPCARPGGGCENLSGGPRAVCVYRPRRGGTARAKSR